MWWSLPQKHAYFTKYFNKTRFFIFDRNMKLINFSKTPKINSAPGNWNNLSKIKNRIYLTSYIISHCIIYKPIETMMLNIIRLMPRPKSYKDGVATYFVYFTTHSITSCKHLVLKSTKATNFNYQTENLTLRLAYYRYM
jgi:hypothetical protein